MSDDDWLDDLPELEDAGDGRQLSRDATVSGYRTAYDHARAIVDAVAIGRIGGCWAAAKVPAERGPMVEAIAARMRKEIDRGAHAAIVGVAVDDVLERRPARR